MSETQNEDGGLESTSSTGEAEASVVPSIPRLERPVRAVEILCGLIMAMLASTVALQAIASHTVDFTPPGLYELIRLLVIYLVCIGAVAAYYRGTNLAVTGRWSPGKISFELFVLAVSVALAATSVRFLVIQGFAVSPASLLGLPLAIGYLPILIFAVGTAIVSVVRIVHALRGRTA